MVLYWHPHHYSPLKSFLENQLLSTLTSSNIMKKDFLMAAFIVQLLLTLQSGAASFEEEPGNRREFSSF
jgi:hypothetical protein